MSSPNWPPTWLRRAEAQLRAGRRVRSLVPAPAGTIVLGTGSADRRGVAGKASTLDRARRAGVDVPEGLIVLHGAALGRFDDAAGDWLRERGVRTCAVRSAFASEDSDTSSRAGWYRTELDVPIDSLAAAIARVRSSAEDGVRTDVLVMEMVPAECAGVVFSEPGTYDDVVNVVDGLADQLVSGSVEGERLLLPRLEAAPSGWQARLQALLRDVRVVFGDRPWDVEWADDGARCRLLQVRPITARTVRDELLTLANHAEILPELPSTLMTGVIDRAGPDLFAWYRRRVPGLPADRDFLHVVAGRPMINLSLLEDMMRHLGLPTALVSDSIGGQGGVARPVAPARLVRRSPSLVRLGLAQVTAVLAARRNERRVAAIGADGATSFGEALDQLHDSYVTLVTGMFPLSSAIGPPLAVLRRAGTLLDHASTHRTITTELADRLGELRAAPPPQRSGRLRRFLDDFGHRGVYESDIARPRFRDDLDRLLGDAFVAPPPADGVIAADSAPPPQLTTRRTVSWWLTRPVWLAAARPLAARERYRHEAMRSFASIRASLESLAGRAAIAGQLTTPEDLWVLDVDQARSLDDGAVFDAEFVGGAQRARERLAQLRPPHVVHRFDDPADWDTSESAADAWHGLPLTVGTVAGRAWVLTEPADRLPDGFDPASTVLVARSIDAGWVTTLPLVAGAAIEIGGDLSHGSILVRELGVPAITNARGVISDIETGDEVVLDAGAGRLTTPGVSPRT